MKNEYSIESLKKFLGYIIEQTDNEMYRWGTY